MSGRSNRLVALIDYGAGNLTSVRKAFAAVDAAVVMPARPRDLADAAAVVIPGVGHFGATANLDDEWRAAILAHIEAGKPLLGICLGLQFLFDGSTEAPDSPGLGVLGGACRRLGASATNGGGAGIKVPHVGWNSLLFPRPSRLFAGIAEASQVYFTHSYAAPVTDACVATADHGCTFASAVERGAIAGVQFHPEKSGGVGLRVLRNFLSLL